MAQIPPIDDAYINEIIKSNGPYNPALLTTQGLKLRELIRLLRDRMEQGDAEAVHKTGDESISGTKTFNFIKAEGLSVNNLANPSLDTVISPATGVQTKLLNITEGAFEVQLSSSALAASRSQLLQDRDGIIALTSDLADFTTRSQFDSGLASKIDISEKGFPGGVSTLDSGGKILASQLPDSISGALTYQGTWDAATNAPALANPPASSTKGYYHVTNTAGTQFGITFAVGDWIVSNGAAWEKVDNSDAVTTVFGRLGNILANEGDYSNYYPLLTGSYADPSWITSLAYSKLTGTPNLTVYELLTNKQNSLLADGTGVKYPNVDAVNAGLFLKVDKIAGKGLSTEDYTTVEKNKLALVNNGTSTLTNNISGNANTATLAGSVTNGLYSTGSYANPSWLTSLDYSKITNVPSNSSFYTANGTLTSHRSLAGGTGNILTFRFNDSGTTNLATIWNPISGTIHNEGTWSTYSGQESFGPTHHSVSVASNVAPAGSAIRTSITPTGFSVLRRATGETDIIQSFRVASNGDVLIGANAAVFSTYKSSVKGGLNIQDGGLNVQLGNFELSGNAAAAQGIIMKSPNGTRWKLTVTDAGTAAFVAV